MKQNRGKSNMRLAKTLKHLRKLHGLDQADIARESQESKDRRGWISQPYICKLESGKETNPSMAKIVTLSRILGVDPNELCGWKERERI